MADAQQPGERYWSVVEPFSHTVSTYDGPGEFARQLRASPPKAGHLFAAHWCQSEVRNGGLHQFFSNSTGVLAPGGAGRVPGHRAFGVGEHPGRGHAVLRRAVPREQAERQELLAARRGRRREEWDPFFALDERFYSWLHAEPDRWERAADRFAEAPDAGTIRCSRPRGHVAFSRYIASRPPAAAELGRSATNTKSW